MSYNKFRDASSKAPPPSGRKWEKEPWELTNFKLEAGEVALARVINPSSGFFSRTFHFWNRPGTCTCDIPVFGDKCVYCFYHQKGYEEAKKAGKGPDGKEAKNKFDKLWKRMAYVPEVIDFRFSHIGKDPEDPEKAILVPCGNIEPLPKRSRCPLCMKGETRIFGGRKLWEVSMPQFRALTKVDAQIGEFCVTPMDDNSLCGRKISLIGFACTGGHTLMDEDTILGMPAEKLSEYVTAVAKCPECGVECLPVDMIVADDDCPKCAGCSPVRATLFDKNIEISCVGQPDGKGGTKKTYNYDRGQPFTDLEEDVWNHVQGINLPQDQVDQRVKDILAPRDLVYAFRPEWVNRDKFEDDASYIMAVLDKQADQLKQPNPYKPGAGQQTTAYQGGGFRRR